MKGLLIRIAAALLALVALFYLLACGPGAQNVNQSQSSSTPAAVNAANSEFSTLDLWDSEDEKACSVKDLDARKNAVDGRIKAKIMADNELRKMFEGHPANVGPKRFSFTVEAVDNVTIPHLNVYVKGLINWNSQLDDFVDRLDDFVKEGCVHKVVFIPEKTGTQPAAVDSGFQWDYCEYPKVACPSGVCAESCTLPTNTNSSNGNANHP